MFHGFVATLFVCATAVAAAAAAAGAPKPAAAGAETRPGVPAGRLHRLTRGINIDAMRERPAVLDPARLDRYQRYGFRHVRLAVGVHLLFDEADPARVKPDGLRAVEAAIGAVHARDMAAVVVMMDVPAALWQRQDYAGRYARFLEALGRALAGTDPELTFLEVVNEPDAERPEAWQPVLAELVAALRRGAPGHTIIADLNQRAAPDRLDTPAAVELSRPVDDPNVVYAFHCYDPFIFTHQGAAWAGDWLLKVKRVPYPSSPEVVQPLQDALGRPGNEDAFDRLWAHGQACWNAARLERHVARAGAWARRHDVPLMCGEFGAVQWTGARREDVLLYYRDMRTALEKSGIPWAVWFDVDDAIVSALGMSENSGQ